ncbi:MAG: transporter [Vicinamibacterales bacterium]
MRTVQLVILAAALMVTGVARDAGAQELAGLVKRLFDSVTVNAPSGTVNHQSHFFLGGDNLTLAVRELNVSLASQLTTFPLASSSGGFSFSVNERGEVVPTSTTFGPLFAERGLTIGRNKFNFGYTFQSTSYDSFEGQSLDSGRLRFISQHNNCCPAGAGVPLNTTDFFPEFERDLLLSSLSLEVDTRTSAFFANYGVTNRFDIGVAIPFVRVEMNASVTGEILRTATAATPTVHSFDGLGQTTRTVGGSGSATGLGDILLRAKYNVFRSDSSAFAGGLDLRLPTGDENDLLGTGATQATLSFIGSGEYGRVSPHVNFGYTFSNGTTSADAADVDDPEVQFGAPAAGVNRNPLDLNVSDEVNYTFGLSVAATPRFTLGFDVRGRTIREVPRFTPATTTYVNRGPGATLPTASFSASDEFVIETRRGNLTQLLGVVGGKINLGRTLLLNVSVLFPMNDQGLKSNPTPVIGFDYVF